MKFKHKLFWSFLSLQLIHPLNLRAEDDLSLRPEENLPSLENMQETLSKRDGIILRNLSYQWIYASTLSDQKTQVEEMRKGLLNNIEVVGWPVEEKDFDKILKAADLSDESELFQQIFHMQVPQMAMKISQTIDEQEELFIKLFPQNYFDVKGLGHAIKMELIQQKLIKATKEGREDILKKIPDGFFLEVIKAIDQHILSIKFSEYPEVKMLKDSQTGFDFNVLPKNIRPYVEKMSVVYFDEMSLFDKKKILLGVLKLPPYSSSAKKLGSILNNTGPALQKLFQLIGQEAKGDQVKKIMDELKENVKPFSFDQVKKTIAANIGGRNIDEVFSEINPKPLAAATVGQVHMGKLKNDDRKVIIKIMRPNLIERAKKEFAPFHKYADSPAVEKFVQQMEDSLLEELDFTHEASFMQEGAENYDRPEKGFRAVPLVDEVPPTQTLLVMELAEGNSYASYKNDKLYLDLQLKNEALKKFLMYWFDRAVFQPDGFFHADLHGGNVFIQTRQKNGPKLEHSSRPYLLTVIDFGSVGHLSIEEQRAMVEIGMGTIIGSPEVVLDGFHYISDIPEEKIEALLEDFQSVIDKEDLNLSAKVNELVAQVIGEDISVPRNFILFNRGRTFLEKQIEGNNKLLDQIDPKKKLGRVNLDVIYQKSFLRYLPASTLKSLLKNDNDNSMKFERNKLRYIMKKLIRHPGKFIHSL